MYKNQRFGNAKKESPESHWSSGSSTAATLTATVSDDIVHDGDDGDDENDGKGEDDGGNIDDSDE